METIPIAGPWITETQILFEGHRSVRARADPKRGSGGEKIGAAGDRQPPFFHSLSLIPACPDTSEAVRANRRNRHSYSISPYGLKLPSALRFEESDVDRASSDRDSGVLIDGI